METQINYYKVFDEDANRPKIRMWVAENMIDKSRPLLVSISTDTTQYKLIVNKNVICYVLSNNPSVLKFSKSSIFDITAFSKYLLSMSRTQKIDFLKDL
jgi:hypothetical protein